MRYTFSLCFVMSVLSIWAQPKLGYKQNQTLTYPKVIEAYQYYDQTFAGTKLFEVGLTDSGEPLHLFLMGQDVEQPGLSISELASDKTVLFINNGIHPGESCGIDASLLLIDSLVNHPLPDSVLIAVIPVYNVGGALNRNSATRTNQDGPKEHGFRGNARNLDLNRDFIKADALNTKTFYAIFHALKPHIFIDTHTSNGADYQYTISLISTQRDKLNPVLSKYLDEQLEPTLYKGMAANGWPMTPYVNVFGDVPNHGFSAFLETPRYASGYTALFNTIGFITETHMLKPYQDRVESTFQFLKLITEFVSEHSTELVNLKAKAIQRDLDVKNFALNWQVDRQDTTRLEFAGYRYEYLNSEIHGGKRLKYHRDQPETFPVDYFKSYQATDSAVVPRFYIIPQAWRHVVERLQSNDVIMTSLKTDTAIKVAYYRIEDAQFSSYPYEGHFPLQDASVKKKYTTLNFSEGDWVISLEQPSKRFLVNTLEPLAADSYLRWNFFDAIFQQKEYFSAYVFEDEAATLLEENPSLKNDFVQWKKSNPEKANNPYQALSFIHRRSAHYEDSHLRYPVYRVE